MKACSPEAHATLLAPRVFDSLPFAGIDSTPSVLRSCPRCGRSVAQPVRRMPTLAIPLPFGHVERDGVRAVVAYERGAP